MKFNGVMSTTAFIDNKDSTVTVEEKFHSGGQLAKPIRKYYEINELIHSERELHEWFLKFVSDVLNDKTKLDVSTKYRTTKHGDEQGYYIAVSCYTVLEY